MPGLSQKIKYVNESIISKISTFGEQQGAINMASGYPDFQPPSVMRQHLADIAAKGPHQYSDDNGDFALRKALADCRKAFSGETWDPDKEVLITCGGTEALMAALMTILDPGDKALIFTPAYEAYATDTRLCGGQPLFVPLHEPDYTFDEAELESAFKAGPKVVILCNPSNPCGRVFSKDELLVIARLAEKYDTFVLVDEVYSHIIYAPTVYTYFSSLPGMKERTICCGSLSKTYSITGWRLGYLLAPPQVTEALYKVHECLTLSAPSTLQEAALAGLALSRAYYDELTAMYTKKRDFVMQRLDALGLRHNVPQGAFYMLFDIRSLGYTDDTAFCQDVIEKLGVTLVPAYIFFDQPVHHLVRLQFAIRDDTLKEAMKRLGNISLLKK